jgi:3-hydroxyacyl-[acyl-carrier-protein] dehydratase
MHSPAEKYPEQRAVLDLEAIKQILPHRYPFLLLDRIVELEPGRRAVGVKAVTTNEPFFQGHFPSRAIMPGVLVVEAMAQVAGVMMLAVPENRGKLAYIGAIEKARFRQPVIPGDLLISETELVKSRGEMGKVRCVGHVRDHLVAEAEIMFALVRQ